MNTITIRRFVTPFQRGHMFKGVFACNQLPCVFTLPAIFIINLSSNAQPGTHWVALLIDNSGAAYYFDSFGLPPRNTDILRFLRMHSKKTDYNKRQLQHLSSIKCGRFVCVFAAAALRSVDMDSFFSRFSNNLRINDIVVEGLFNYFDVVRKGIIESLNK